MQSVTTRTNQFLLQLHLLFHNPLTLRGTTRKMVRFPLHLLSLHQFHNLLTQSVMTRRTDLLLPLQLPLRLHSPLTQRETTRRTARFPLQYLLQSLLPRVTLQTMPKLALSLIHVQVDALNSTS